MAVTTKTYTKNYFNKKIEENYFLSDKGFFELNEKKSWFLECSNIEDDVLVAKICAQRILFFLNQILEKNKKFTTVQDYSRTSVNGMCYNIQIIADDYKAYLSHSICINISTIIPFFHIHVLELKRLKENFAKWDGIPKRKKNLESINYKEEIQEIKKFLSKELCLTEFPDFLENELTHNIFTEDIRKEDFTYFKAFFQREYYTR